MTWIYSYSGSATPTWGSGSPALQLVNKTDTNPAAAADLARSKGQHKEQKRVSSQEDEELYQKLRERKHLEKNKCQEEDLERLNQGILQTKADSSEVFIF